MYKLIEFILLIFIGQSQSNLIWSKPQQFLTRTISIIQGDHPSSQKIYSNIGYTSPFTEIPQVILAFSSFQQLQDGMDIVLQQKVITEQLTFFTHQLIIQCNKKTVKNLKITFAAFVPHYFQFFYPHQITLTTSNLKTSNNPDSQYILVKFLSPLDSSHNYDIDIMLSGFSTNCNSDPYISVGYQYYSDSQYFVRITARNNLLKQITINRLLIDRTLQLSQPSNFSFIRIEFDHVIHYQSDDIPSYPDSTNIDYYGNSFLYGIKSFQNQFYSRSDGSIFNRPSPGVDIQITYFNFLKRRCPDTQSYFIQSSQLCYQSCLIGTYYLTGKYCDFCHYSCYSCSGPSQFQCTDCLQGKYRQLTNVSTCQCLDNHYVNSLTNQCQPCSSLILGCILCDSPTNCLGCDPNCTLIGNSCNCPVNYQVCSSINQYFSSNTQTCQCDPQLFRDDNGICQTCNTGCYKCEGSSDNCIQCINQYILISHSCIFFSLTTFLVDGNNAVFVEGQRCSLKTNQGSCISECPNQSYFYEYKCYPTQCPTGTFEYFDISTGQGKCQPCNSPCIQCQVCYFCQRCQPEFYYLENGVCLHCPTGCLTCKNENQCYECTNGYIHNSSNYCVQNLPIVSENCDSQCSFCLISTFCEQCKPGYFLYDKTHQCIQCSLPGIQLSLPPPSKASSQKQCYQICGDGYLYNDQCDDKNTEPGDGCSQLCKIQNQYQCEYLYNYNKSICFKSQYQIQIQMERDLYKNQITMTLQGVGLDLSKVPLIGECGSTSNFLSTQIILKKITFIISFSQNLVQCTFKVDNSTYIPPKIIKVDTMPRALYVSEKQKTRIMVYSYIQNIYMPLSYLFWFYCILAITPFDIWLNYQFIALYYLIMHQKQHNPPGIYGIYPGIKHFFFNFQKNDSFESQLNSCWRILCFYLGIIIFQQVFVRIFIKINKTPRLIRNVFNQVFKKRKYHYVCVHSIFQPIQVYFIFLVFAGGRTQLLYMFVASVNIILIIITLIFGLVFSDQILSVKNHRKYVLFLMLLKTTNILVAGKVYYTHPKYIINASLLLNSVIFFLIFVMNDTYPARQVKENQKNKLLQLKSSSQKSSHKSQQNDSDDQQSGQQSKSVSCLTVIRKINLLTMFTSFIIIMAVLLIYQLQSDDPQNFQIFSIIILFSFTFGMLTIGQILLIIAHFNIIYIYNETNKEYQESIKQPEKSQERLQHKDRSHISVISISKNGIQEVQQFC